MARDEWLVRAASSPSTTSGTTAELHGTTAEALTASGPHAAWPTQPAHPRTKRRQACVASPKLLLEIMQNTLRYNHYVR
eukprot:1709819-Amphidinium_carterae.1